ncbi:conserved Plasmodium protein, unknown function [Plasmodium relictum]|uniref:Uncharacterized protein n=1 Tax=Plasmodium relictum TaxID=85471 RepID=A0A1J1H6M4_PLARL|nr:conserved Plasmodium protein, unknown function [Plasmodium relictum]CRH00307.1 conserved Plasmodium protein, unknown function [Plasmodium relictum]
MNNTIEHICKSTYTSKNKCNDLCEETSSKNENAGILSGGRTIDKYNIKLITDKEYNMENKILENEEIKPEKKKNIDNKKNSIDFESFNQNIFNININLYEKDEENNEENNHEENQDYEDEDEDEDKDTKDGNENENENEEETKDRKRYTKKKQNIKKEKIKDSNNYDDSDDSSYNSIDEVNKILKINNDEKLEKKNRYTYILQHKKRIKDKRKEKVNKDKKNNYLKLNYLRINKTSKENVKRASVATTMLENFSNSDTEYSDDDLYDSKN